MYNTLFLFCGKSGSGKTTIADILENKFGYKQLKSYTTRPPRYENESGHTFITDEEFDKLQNIIAYTEYNGHRYCATKEQIDEASIYVIDVPGIETLLKKYDTNRHIEIIYFDTTVKTRIERMVDRGDSDTAIVGRLHNDESFDWKDKLKQAIADKNVGIFVVDANISQQKLLYKILDYMYAWNKEYICNWSSSEEV